MCTPNHGLVNNLSKKTLLGIGGACWHCHGGVGAFLLNMAVKYRIPLTTWGGESLAEEAGRATYENLVIEFDRNFFTEVSAKLTPKQLLGDDLTEKHLFSFELPTAKECRPVEIKGTYWGDLFFLR